MLGVLRIALLESKTDLCWSIGIFPYTCIDLVLLSDVSIIDFLWMSENWKGGCG